MLASYKLDSQANLVKEEGMREAYLNSFGLDMIIIFGSGIEKSIFVEIILNDVMMSMTNDELHVHGRGIKIGRGVAY